MEPYTFTVDDTAHGTRLDRWLVSQHPELSRSMLQKLIADGQLSCNGLICTDASAKVKPGQVYRLTIPEVASLALEPVAMPLDILYEDDCLLVVNKPAGLTVHPAPGTHEPTLVHGLLAHCGASLSGIGGVARPGIVHRLDKDTSGLMLVAKTDSAHQHLSEQLKNRTLSRTYDAFCWGAPKQAQGVIDLPVGRHPKDRTRMAVVSRGGKQARTHYRLEESFTIAHGAAQIAIASHIRCQLETGRTHQIRVHLNHLGHGLIGDPLYGASTDNRLNKLRIDLDEETKRFLLASRQQALHARIVRFMHPLTLQEMCYVTTLPERLKALQTTLKHLQNRE